MTMWRRIFILVGVIKCFTYMNCGLFLTVVVVEYLVVVVLVS